jgi:acetyltransferase-like isoleucine patch superfamily enzyme
VSFLKKKISGIFKKSKIKKVLFVNYIFQRILGINRDLKISVHYTTVVASGKNITFEGGEKFIKSMAVSGNCYFSAYNGIHFGYDVLFAPNIQIISSNHSYTRLREPIQSNPIVIESNVWIGTNVTILPEVVIGENAIIGAGSIVNKDVPRNSIVVGNPMKIIGWMCDCGNKLDVKDKGFVCNSCGINYSVIDNTLKRIDH